MIYKNVIIKCKIEESVELQKHLFKLSYSWFDNGNRHRQIKRFDQKLFKFVYLIVDSSGNIDYYYKRFEGSDDEFSLIKKSKDLDKFRIIDYKKIVRKEKLKKLNKKIEQS